MNRWGLAYFVVISWVSFGKLMDPASRGHYRVFTSAARALWNQQPSYGSDFGWQTGLEWFYSQTCGLVFYLPFSFLPETIGVWLNAIVMWLVFVWGAGSFFKEVFGSKSMDLVPHPIVNVFWFIVTSEMIGAIVSQKTEILMIGVCFLSVSWISRGRMALAAAALALIANWKLQPLPLIGLLALATITFRRDWRFPVSFVGWFAGWSAVWIGLPYLILPFGYVTSTYAAWGEALQRQLVTQWTAFDHVYNVLRKVIGIDVDFASTQVIGVVVGGSFALIQLVYGHGCDSKPRSYVLSLCLALALGAAYMTSFSPLSQSNGYILAAPLFAVLCLFLAKFPPASFERKATSLAIGFGWFVTSLLTSDLVPSAVRAFTRENALKSLGPLLMAAFVVWMLFARRPERHGFN